MNVFVVISIAIPKTNTRTAPPGARINAVCTRSSKAEEISQKISSNKESTIINGVECFIKTAVISVELDES